MRNRPIYFFIFIVGTLWCAAGCAAPGVPMPPSLELPRPVNDLAAVRKGERVALTWTQPVQTTDRQNLRRLGPTLVCRAIGEFPMKDCGNVVRTLYPEELQSMPAAGGKRPQVIFEEVLPAEVQSATGFATYALEVLNRRNRGAGLSNQVKVSLAPALPAPKDLVAEVAPESVVLSWIAPERIASSSNLNFFYRVFRKPAGGANYVLLQELPVRPGRQVAADRSFEWEHAYDYKVAGVTRVQLASGEPIEFEGEDSRIVHVLPHDIFPPATPSGLQAVFSGPGQKAFVDLTWAPNTEPDLAGYNVFRGEPGGEARQINSQLVRAPSFRDENVVPGHRYIYAVSAVDQRGNQSARSEAAAESVPQP